MGEYQSYADSLSSLVFVTFYICFDQMQNNLISQAGQMETNGTPNDLLPAMNQVGCIVLGPLIQEGLYPFLHRRRVYPTPVSRITIGFAFVTLSMLYAAVVQLLIYRSPPCYDRPGSCGSNQINVWVQAPLYFLISAGEIFAYVTALEYAYDNSPKAMKVVVQAVGLLVGGVGSACAMALTPVARDPYLVVFYGSLTAGMAITTIVFWMLFRERDGLQKALEVRAGPTGAIRDSVHHNGGRAANKVSDIAPLLQPIDAGDPIWFPSSMAPGLFQTTGSHSQPTNQTPPIPRKSSRRPQRVDARTDCGNRSHPMTHVPKLCGTHSLGQGCQDPPQPGGEAAVLAGRGCCQARKGSRRYYAPAVMDSQLQRL